MKISAENLDNEKIIQLLKNFEVRIARLESRLDLEEAGELPEADLPSPKPREASSEADTLEFRIGEFWLAKVGIVVLAMGIAFLLTLPYQGFPSFLPSGLGYLLVAGMVALSRYWKNSIPYLSRYMMGGALLLLYFTTMRLHFFSAHPAILSRPLEVILLLAATVVTLTVAVRRNSVYLVGLGLTMGYVTALISENAYSLFILLTVLALLASYFKAKYQWPGLLIYAIVATYFVHFVWFLNNPVLGNELQLVSAPQINLSFILAYALIFALSNLFRDQSLPEDNMLIMNTFLNCLGGYGLFLLISVTRFQSDFNAYHLLASILFLALSIAFWIREKSRYSTFFFALLGYSALSVAIIGQFDRPDFFLWLCWQSLVVISTAIWFRSKFIIVANFAIYVLLFFAYLFMAGRVGIISLSFGVVALLSARILNWKKHRLELRTELMRNAYLITALFIFPYAFYHIVPSGYVTLSWIGITIFYYLLSRLLDNKKYRWMALVTLLLAVARVFLVDTTDLEPSLRVASFLILGVVLLAISLLYNRMRAKSDSEETIDQQSD